MPQATLEYSDNVNVGDLSMVLGIHKILSKELPTQLETCKTRIVKHKDYFIGNGNKGSAFMHIDIRIMVGRTEDVINSTPKAVLQYIGNNLPDQGPLKLDINAEISNLPTSYIKHIRELSMGMGEPDKTRKQFTAAPVNAVMATLEQACDIGVATRVTSVAAAADGHNPLPRPTRRSTIVSKL